MPTIISSVTKCKNKPFLIPKINICLLKIEYLTFFIPVISFKISTYILYQDHIDEIFFSKCGYIFCLFLYHWLLRQTLAHQMLPLEVSNDLKLQLSSCALSDIYRSHTALFFFMFQLKFLS